MYVCFTNKLTLVTCSTIHIADKTHFSCMDKRIYAIFAYCKNVTLDVLGGLETAQKYKHLPQSNKIVLNFNRIKISSAASHFEIWSLKVSHIIRKIPPLWIHFNLYKTLLCHSINPLLNNLIYFTASKVFFFNLPCFPGDDDPIYELLTSQIYKQHTYYYLSILFSHFESLISVCIWNPFIVNKRLQKSYCYLKKCCIYTTIRHAWESQMAYFVCLLNLVKIIIFFVSTANTSHS